MALTEAFGPISHEDFAVVDALEDFDRDWHCHRADPPFPDSGAAGEAVGATRPLIARRALQAISGGDGSGALRLQGLTEKIFELSVSVHASTGSIRGP